MDPFDRMIGDPLQHLAQIILWVDTVEFCRLGLDPTAVSPAAKSLLARFWG
jgi:hypothetical protein